jgi:PIN domain nuclease of toxin-antitoxin system
MKLLLDTHTFIWWVSEPGKLSKRALKACENKKNELILSVVSVWEMQIKIQLKKLRLKHSLTDLIIRQQTANDLQILPVSLEHVLALENLPSHHRDPFDRLLIAQSMQEQLQLVSKDKIFKQYSIKPVW